ncbi:MAG TPA: prepilin-type N-terminal cleavage/methylation domain-containing protein [Verrucomicrobiae bacterium]|nr:prepilin-type N-terminal cleavage/methylation domain-containing protein [Verrucomicrobiae bacterium]
MSRRRSVREQAGFTIIELMIATTVLSVILLMATAIMISIGNLFYKGVSQARVQDNIRTITDDVSNHLRLGSAVANPTGSPLVRSGQSIYSLCIDTTRYSYVIGMQIGAPLNHVLWRDTLATAGSCAPADLSTADPAATNGGVAGSGTELIGPKSRLTAFSLSSTTTPYTINVGVAYGDPSLSPAGVCLGTSDTSDQFCSTATLTTTVDKRSN